MISVGTNSCRLLIVRRDDAGLRVEHHDIRYTRIGEDLTAGGALKPEAVRRTLAAMAEFAQLAKRADEVFIIGTQALREASDSTTFERQVRESLGAEIHVLTGAEEARASFTGARWALEHVGPVPDAVTVIDIGGGSTEFAVRKKRRGTVNVESLPIGGVVLKERFFKHDPPLPTELTACRLAVRLEIDRLGSSVTPAGALVAVGGTADTAARMLNAYDASAQVRVATVRRDDIADLLRLTSSLPLEERKRLHGLPEARADIFPAGLIILEEIAQRAAAREIIVTEADLLLGFVLQGIEA